MGFRICRVRGLGWRPLSTWDFGCGARQAGRGKQGGADQEAGITCAIVSTP